MKINEVEKLLNITRANIRFYEKEGLIEPARYDNGYRDYSDLDIVKLKRIIVLRKLGVSLPDIRRIFDNEAQLNEVMQLNADRLEKQIFELNGALLLSKEIAKQRIGIETFDEDLYLRKINEEENYGVKFNDIFNDCIDFEKEIFAKMWKNVFFINFPRIEKKIGFWKAVIVVLVICVIRGLMSKFVWHNGTFLESFIYPFELFAGASLVMIPLYLLSKKHEKTASVIITVIFAVCVLFLLAVAGVFFYAVISYLIDS